MNNKPTRKTASCGSHAVGRTGDKSPEQQDAASSNHGQTRTTKRKTSPEKTTRRKRTRVADLAEQDGPSTSSEQGVNRGGKRKLQEDGDRRPKTTPRKKKRLDPDQKDEDTSPVDTVLVSPAASSSDPLEGCSKVEEVVVKSKKRKADAGGGGPRRKRTRGHENKDLPADAQRAAFEAKYKQERQLGEGGCGSVFAGYRRLDELPVAIKHIPQAKVLCKHVDNSGRQLSIEVAVMLLLAAESTESVGAAAPVSLLDWYDLGEELILVMERPIPAEDLLKYRDVNGGLLQEEEAKIILKQLVEAAINLEKKKIFHRDIKPENILIQTDSDVPRVRLIDFGLSCFCRERSRYQVFYGTVAHIPPEYYSGHTYMARPTTVWQMGVVLFEVLHRDTTFETPRFLGNRLRINTTLSKHCQDFLNKCLAKVPEQRPTLEDLLLHPWLR